MGNVVNPPMPNMEGAPGFPRDPDLTLMMDMRQKVRELGAAMGLKEVGCGVGIGGADVQFRLGDRHLFVFIEIKELP